MKKQFLKLLAVVAMLLCGLSAGAVDWAAYGWLGNGSGNAAYTEKYKITLPTDNTGTNGNAVNIQTVAEYTGIYCTFPAAISAVSVEDYKIEGAGMWLGMNNFTGSETEVTVTYATGTSTFTVYYADGVDEYVWCHATNSQLHRSWNGVDYDTYLTWATAENGDVVITIDGAEFRNGGFENKNGKWEESWNVLSGTGLATVESASLYFDGGTLSADNQKYTIAKKEGATLPEGAVLQFAGRAFSWKVVENGNEHGEYFLNPDMKYSYGVNCISLDAPTNVAVSVDGVITFTAVENAEKYIANIYSNGALVSSEEVTNGATLAFKSYVAATYTVKVVAVAGGMESPASAEATWNAQASPLPASKFCSTPADAITAKQGYCSPLFTIQTLTNGNVTIVISAGEGNEGETIFRNPMGIGNFMLNGSKEDFATYFEGELTDNYTYTLTLKSADNKPAPGAVISYAGMIEARSSINGNDWSTYQLNDYLYGTTCPSDVAVTGVSLDVATAELPINKTLTLKAKVAPANAGNKNVTWTSSNTEVATVADGVVTPVAKGSATITVTTEEGSFTATCTVAVVDAYYTEPNVAAPVPAHKAENVLSLYSDTYTTAVNITTYNAGWWQGPSMEEKEINGNKYLRYFGTMTGVNGWEFATLDASGMTHLHVDIWASVTGTIAVGPICTVVDAANYESKIVLNVEQEKWNSFDIKLADYPELFEHLATIFQNKLSEYATQSEFSVDNFYFWKEGNDGPATGVEAAEAASVVRKAIENGQVVIIRDGIRYNVMGNVIR